MNLSQTVLHSGGFQIEAHSAIDTIAITETNGCHTYKSNVAILSCLQYRQQSMSLYLQLDELEEYHGKVVKVSNQVGWLQYDHLLTVSRFVHCRFLTQHSNRAPYLI